MNDSITLKCLYIHFNSIETLNTAELLFSKHLSSLGLEVTA